MLANDQQLDDLYLTGWWAKTRAFMMYRFLQHAGPLLDLIKGATAVDEALRDRIEAEIRRILTQIFDPSFQQMMMKSPHEKQRALLRAAVAVCPDADKLGRLIANDRAVRAISNRVEPKRALAALLRFHLNECNWEVRGFKPDAQRIWTKLRKISTERLAEYERCHGRAAARGYQCSDEHFQDIKFHIDPRDDRIGRIKISTIEMYFGRWCEECRSIVGSDVLDSTSTEAFDLPQPDQVLIGHSKILSRLRTKALRRCLEKLDPRLRETVEIVYFSKARDPKIIPFKRSASDATGSPNANASVLDDGLVASRRDALTRLRACMERTLMEEIDEY